MLQLQWTLCVILNKIPVEGSSTTCCMHYNSALNGGKVSAWGSLLWRQCQLNHTAPAVGEILQQSLLREIGASQLFGPIMEAKLWDDAPIFHKVVCGLVWGDLWLQIKSQSGLPFPLLWLAQLFWTDCRHRKSVAPLPWHGFSSVWFMGRFKLPLYEIKNLNSNFIWSAPLNSE